jgi:peptide/nickel transport system substrate-binding protein
MNLFSSRRHTMRISGNPRLRLPALGACFAALALLAAGCGSSSSTAGSKAKKGGTITVLSAGDVDHIDPGQMYYSFSYEIGYATQRPLLAYKPTGVGTVPDLAASAPRVSRNGKVVTVKLRRGVRFSPPVNREVTSADVKYAIERGFASSVANGYVGVYFGDLVGAPKRATSSVPEIAGIETPDSHTIVFRLERPSGVFQSALGMLATAPVPAEYAKPFDAKTTSDYGAHQVATGPYMIDNNRAGKLTGYTPGRRVVLVRNPNWKPSTSWRPAFADRVVFKEGFQDPTVTARTIESGAADANGDTPPPPAELRSITSNASEEDRLTFTPVGGPRYVALNTSKPPFDNRFVRLAVAYALDRNAMRLTRGGPVDGRIATHFIDPSFTDKGFVQAGGFRFNPFNGGDGGFSGNLDKARQMLRKAGFANGRFSGPTLTQVSDNTPPGSDTARVVASDLARIGMKVRTISVTHATMFTRFCSVPKQEPNICPNVGWIADFHEPQTQLDATFNGKNILPVNNSNWPQLDDRRIDALMDRAETIVDPQRRYAAWGRIDQLVTKTAAAIPWLWETYPTLFSSHVSKAPELWNSGAPDVTFMQVLQ